MRMPLWLAPSILSLAAIAPAAPAVADGGVSFTDIATGGGAGLAYERAPSDRLDILLAQYSDNIVDVLGEYFFTPEKPHGAPGLALVDYDRDGDLDIYVTNGPGTANSLFQNQLRQTGTVTFVDVAAAAGVAATAQDSQGVCFGDLDNDGDDDLYVLGMQDGNLLFRNNGNGTFSDITAASGTAGNRPAASCAMGDVNGDGLLDLFVANTFALESREAVTINQYNLNVHNQLFVNQGGNTFTDASASSGIETIPNVPFAGAAMITWPAAIVDVDRDGDQDIIMAGDQRGVAGPELVALIHLYQNDGSGHFTSVSAASGLGSRIGSWRGLAVGDLNCDSTLDLFASNWGDYIFFPGTPIGAFASAWFLQQPGGTFTDPGPGALVTIPTGWGTSATDYDNDGDLDLVVYGGDEQPLFYDDSNPGVILQNQGCSGTFTWDQAALAGSTNHTYRTVQGLATGDLNDDGFPDIASVASTRLPPTAPLAPFFNNPAGSIFDPTGLGIFTTVPADPFFSQFQVVWYEPENGDLSVEINSGGNGNRWVKIATVGAKGLTPGGAVNRSGIGAVVSFTPHGGQTVSRPVLGGSSYASQDALAGTFGLGNQLFGTVDVLWPGGVKNRLYGALASERLTLPEIPCSYDAAWPNLGVYVQCVQGALQDLRQAGIINGVQKARLLASALLAYHDSH